MKTIIYTWTQKVNNLRSSDIDHFWGIGDTIRGTIHLFQLSKKHNFRLIVDIQLHPISKFLRPIEHEFKDFILTNQYDINFIFPKDVGTHVIDFLNGNNDILYFFGNGLYTEELTNECKVFIQNILTPNDDFKSYISDKMQEIPHSNYRILHYRLGDDELVRGDSSDHLSNKHMYLEHVNLNRGQREILMSDCASFKKHVKENSNMFMFDLDIAHIGYSQHEDRLKDTLVEFFIMSKAEKIKSFSIYNWQSGFAKSIHDIYDIPLESAQL